MAVSLQALLNIRANVTGQQAVQGLNNAIGGIKGAAGAATGGLKNLTNAAGMGGLAGAMGALAPLLSVAGLVGMAKASINAGKAMYDMSQRTGASVEMLAKFKKAAGTTGTSIEAVEKGLLRLNKAMYAAAAGDIGGKTKEEMEEARKAVEDGEKAQTRAIEREADRKMAALDRETDRRLSALQKRYRREEQLLKDSWDDEAELADQKAQDSLDAQLKAAERNYQAKRQAIEKDKALDDKARTEKLQALEDAYDTETDAFRTAAAKAQKDRDRAARDQQQAILDQLDERKQAEMEAVKASAEGQKLIIKDQTTYTVDAIKAASAESIKALKIDPGETALSQELDDLGLSGKGASEAFRELGISVKNQDGSMKTSSAVMLELADRFKAMDDPGKKAELAMKLFGKAGAELVPMLNMGGSAIDALSVKMTTAFAEKADEYSDKMVALGGKIGAVGADIAIALLPAITAITDALVGFFDWMKKQDPIIQNLIVTLGLAAIAFTALAPAITALVAVGTPLVGLLGALFTGGGAVAGAFATLSGILGATVPFFTGLGAAIAAFVTWPVVLVAALVAAGVAIFVFRDQIAEFFSNMIEMLTGVVEILWETGEPIRTFWVNLWASIQGVTSSFFDWIGGVFKAIGDTFAKFVVEPLSKAWRFIVDTAKSALRGLLQWAANAINGVIRLINNVIAGINRVRSALGQSTLGTLAQVTVPAFAEGGFVTGPTLAMIGDNPGGREYVVPENKAAGFAANYLAGARGAAAIPTTSTGAGGGPAGPVTVNLTTGPVMQAADGQRSVSLEEVERLVRDGVSQTIRQLRTPAGRYATGVR